MSFFTAASEEELRVFLIGLSVVGGLTIIAIGAIATIYDRVKANRATQRLREEFPR